MNTQVRSTRARLFSGVGTAVLGALIASGAHAADTTIDQAGAPTATATAGLSVNSPLTNNGAVTAGVDGADGKIGHEGEQTGTSNTVSANEIAASATGNNNQAAIPALSSIGADGAAILNMSTNAPGVDDATGVVSSSVSDSRLSVSLEDFQSGSASNTGNTISAATTLNSASSSISGSVPVDYVSTTPGSSSLDYPDGAGNQFSATGTVVVSSVQQAVGTGQGAGSNASVTGNAVSLDLTSTANNTVTSGPTLEDNAISATFKGNTARNTAEIEAGLNPQFAGSAVISNLQVNAADGASDPDEIGALNSGSSISASVAGDTGFVNTLNGSLSVAGNSITSAATGNEAVGATPGVAGNRILLGDGMSIAGAGTPASGANIAYDGGGVVSTVAADLVIHNSQGNTGTAGDQSLNSVTEDATIEATVQALSGGSVDVSGNRIAASTTGNNASSGISTGENTATFGASVAVSNQQTNDDASVDALTTGSKISATVGVAGVADSADADSVSVTNNTSAASAYGNQASQDVSIEANSVVLGAGPATLTGGTGPDGRVVATGAATVSNLQSRYSGAVSATNADSDISLSSLADDTTGSSLAVSSNRQEAVALGSSGSNALSLTSGASTGSGAGIASVQIDGGGSPVEARLTGANVNVNIAGDLGDTVGGSVASTDNLQRAIGYGNSASNTLAVAGNIANLPIADETDRPSTVNFDQAASNGLVFDNSAATAPSVVAAYGLLNDQSIQSNVTAAAEGQSRVSVGTDAQDASSVTNSSNALVGAAYGNDAANAATVTLGQIDTGIDGGFAAVANVTNVQAVGGGAAIRAEATGGDVVLTDIGESVTDSSVTTSGNAVQALAYGNRSTGNTLNVEGTNIDTAPALGDSVRGGATITAGALVTNASFSVQNAQAGQGSITATQRDLIDDASQVRVTVGDGVSNSSIAAEDNLSVASATSNSAANSLGVSATGLQTTSAVQNFQTTSANVSALIGLAGVPGSPGSDGTDDAPFNFTTTGDSVTGSYDSENDVWTITSGSQSIDPVANGLTPEQVAALLDSGDGWVQPGGAGTAITRDATGRIVSNTVYADLTEGGGATLNGTVLGTPPTPPTASIPNGGGVTIAVGGPLGASHLSVDGNTNAGSVTGNSANNALTVAATNIDNGSGLTTSAAGVVGTDILDNSIVGAVADHALSNIQAVESDTLTSEVFGTFAVDAAADADITGSTLSVSDNTQSASSVANTAANSLKVGDENASSVSAGSALASLQTADAAVTATSDAELFAPAAVANSTVNLTGNSNTSLGVLNDVNNTLTVQAANIAPVDAANNVSLGGDVVTGVATGDHVVSNRQVADTSVTSTASTRLYNEDQIATATSGLVDSSLTIGDNSTVAEASANRALNTLSISGGAAQGASAGIANAQSSSAAVQSNATTSATLMLAADPGDPLASPDPIPASAALNGSSAAISGNSTTALARGNAATNVLNASAGSSYGAGVGGAGSTIAATQSVAAAAGVLNNQDNSGGVTASSLNVSYSVALNATPGDPAASNSSVRVAGNQLAAQAYGNSASNSVTLAALNTGAPTAAVGNYQVNSGAIRATATTVSFGTTGVGAVAGGSFGVTGNQVSASAIGNSAVSTITAAR